MLDMKKSSREKQRSTLESLGKGEKKGGSNPWAQ